MIHIEKYAAIDIGSNAIRLLIATLIEKEGFPTQYKKTSLVRVPIRLGADVFLNGRISVNNYRACATSAMREADNGEELARQIRRATGINIQIINGEEEAAIIASTNLWDQIDPDKTYLYVDVGGGSTEFTVFSDRRNIISKSFKLGTVRILNDMVSDQVWDDVKKWIKKHTSQYEKISLIGSGGNINSIYKSSGKKIGKPLSYLYIYNYYQKLRSMNYHERIFNLQMNPDRADVILPATRIYLSAMKWSNAKNIYVPKIGLSDGIIKTLYNERQAKDIEVNT